MAVQHIFIASDGPPCDDGLWLREKINHPVFFIAILLFHFSAAR
jgi:hypothetical protein